MKGNRGRERERERRRLSRPGRRRASRRALISTGFRRTTDGQRRSHAVDERVSRFSVVEPWRAHHEQIETEREKVAAIERDNRSRTTELTKRV